MMNEAKGVVRETEAFQYIKKPDGFGGVAARPTDGAFKPSLGSWRKVEETPEPQFETATKHLI